MTNAEQLATIIRKLDNIETIAFRDSIPLPVSVRPVPGWRTCQPLNDRTGHGRIEWCPTDTGLEINVTYAGQILWRRHVPWSDPADPDRWPW